jgi:CheY-like chemotaxis protein
MSVPLRVLVVDDNADAAESLAILLNLWGHAARVACSGVEALSLAPNFRPQVVVVDISMPGMDGYEVARRLRADHSGIVLVALSGLTSAEHQRQCEEAGFVLCLLKPADLDHLREFMASQC